MDYHGEIAPRGCHIVANFRESETKSAYIKLRRRGRSIFQLPARRFDQLDGDIVIRCRIVLSAVASYPSRSRR